MGSSEIGLSDFFSKQDGSGKQKQSTPSKGLSLPDLNQIVTSEGADHLKPVIQAIYNQESGSGSNARTSSDGARGGMQIMPGTFQRYAKPGESINNPDDNMRVGVRIIKDLGDKFGNDPAKIATGYFSGEGNVNKERGQAFKKDHADGNGKRVSSYVGDILAALGGVSDAHAESMPEASKPDLDKAPKWTDIVINPEFSKLSQEQQSLAKKAYFDHYIRPHAGGQADSLLQQFMAAPNEPRDRTMGEVASDTGAQLLEGMHNILGAVPNLFAPEGDIAGYFNQKSKDAQELQSDPLKARIARADAAIKEADKDGVMAQIAEAAGQYFSDPALAARFIVTNLPSMIPGIGVAKLTQMAAKARGASAATAGALATTAAGATGAVLNAGGARGEAFNDIKETLIKQGMDPDQAEEEALKDSRVSAAVGGLAGFVSGKTGLENSLFGQGTSKSAVKAFAKGAAAELGGEQLEEVAPKVATNYMAGQYDNRRLGQDVGRTIIETGIASSPGATFSGGVSAANTFRQPEQPEQPEQQQVDPQDETQQAQPEVQPGATQEPSQPQADASEHPTVQTANSIVRDLAQQAGIPEEVVLPKSPLSPENLSQKLNQNTGFDKDVLNFAEGRLNQLLEKRDGHIQTGIGDNGLSDQMIEGQGLSPQEQQELDALQSMRGNVSGIKDLYGLNPQQTPEEKQPESVKKLNPVESAPVADRSEDDLRQQMRNANDGRVRNAIAEELRNRDREKSDREAADNLVTVSEKRAKKTGETGDSRVNDQIEKAQETIQHVEAAHHDVANKVNAAAHEAATSPENDRPEPTEAQKQAGNYKKGHLNFDGLDISVENPAGSKRSGTDPNGKPWSVDMTAHYGYLKRSEGADGDQVDVYVPENPVPGSPVYVFDQFNHDGKFDEHKAVVGVSTQEEAQKVYDAHFSDGSGPQRRRGVTAMSASDFKQWAQNGNTQKPLSKPKTEREAKERKKPIKDTINTEQSTSKVVADTGTKKATKKEEHKPKTEKESKARRAKQKEISNATQANETKQTETPGTAETATPKEPDVAIEQQDTAQFAKNKIFTAAKVAAARARLKSKLNTLNSGVDPELLQDGITLAGAYIESGFRTFGEYSDAMINDLGEKVRPYLRSFYEAARHYPGLDTTGMTTAAELDLMEKEGTASHVKQAEGNEIAIGTIEKPKKRTKERKKTDLVLKNDYGVSSIDGYDNETGEGASGVVKRQFLSDTKKYLEGVQKSLAAAGFVPHARNGKALKPVSVNEGGIAVSGDVTLSMFNPEKQRGIYIHIGGTSLRGTVPTTKSGVSVMMRVTKENDPSGGDNNRWMPVNMTDQELANAASIEVEKVADRVNPVAKTPDQLQDTTKPQEVVNANPISTESVSAGNNAGDTENAATGNGHSKPLDNGVAENGESTDSDRGVSGSADSAGRKRAKSTQRSEPESPVELGESRSDGADASAADTERGAGRGSVEQDHSIDAEEIGKGGLAKKYRDNVDAIKLLKNLETEGRKATPQERKTLAKYVGWGAMKGPFDPENKAWEKQHAELKELLTDSEYKAARASTRNAHYTSPVAVGAMYSALQRLGFNGGRLLEPSLGVGNFFGLMPKDLRNSSQLHGVELDSLTSRLAAALYPKAKIAQSTGFEDFDIPSEYFDVVIGNPPFGNEPLVDKERSAYSGFSIHNYFLAKSIDKLRPGGIMAVVVSHNFMDAQDGRVRKWIGERASLIGGVRLPNTAFKENAGTEVVTDILVFQKNDPNGLNKNAAPWQDVADQTNINSKTDEPVTHKVNQFFVSQPQYVLGKPSAAGKMYSANEYTVESTGDIGKQLSEWVDSLPKDIFTSIARTNDSKSTDMAVPDGIKVGSFYVDASGKVMRRGADVMGEKTAEAWQPKSEAQLGRMKGMIAIRDTLRTQMRMERSPDATHQEIEDNRAELNRVYDDFIKKYKFINTVTNRGIFLDDTEAHLIQGLEFDYDRGISKAVAEKEGIEPKAPSANKADIFKRRVAFPPQDFLKVSTAKDALLASLNYRGGIDLPYMSEVYGKSPEDIIQELGDVVFDDPQSGIVAADEYLSGDVKTKLQEAKDAAQADKKYTRNVEALEKVIPKDKTPSEISVSIGASFVPADVYQQFIKHISGVDADVSYIKATGQWVTALNNQGDTTLNTAKFGTSDLPAISLFQLTMLGRGAVVKKTVRNPDGSTTTYVLEQETEAAREKQNTIKAEWQKWLWQDAERADKIASIYNDKMNRIVLRKYDGSHMSFPGMNPSIELLGNQKNGVWRGLQSYRVLFDHVVGAGKTFAMTALAMEMRRLGIARKPFFAVPNHLTLQWMNEFTRLYPGSNVLAATPEDFSKDNRERMFAKIITGDWDAVIVGHSSLKKIGLPPETESEVLQEQIDELAASIEEMKRARGDRRIVADMERIRKNLEAKMKDKLAAIGERSKVVTFDELGIDAMMIDEMHEFKNLAYHTTMDRNPGMGNPAGSSKAFDLFVKTQWLFNTFGEKAPYVTATGTPVSNSLVEMFNMQRYMQYPTLKREGLNVFDAWAKQFGSVENVYEVAPSGSGYRQSTRFAKFTNLPALMSLYNTFADTITLDDLKVQEEAQGKRFPVPKISGGRPTLIVAKRSPAVAALMGVPRAQVDDNGNIEFSADLNKEIKIQHDEKSDKYDAYVGDNHVGKFDTEQDARLKIAELALSPVVSVNPDSIVGRFANLRQLTRDTKGKVNALSLTGEANKAGLDYRLINPSAPDFKGSKINLAVDNMMRIYKQWQSDRGTQLVFCDLSVPLSARSSFSNKPRRLYVRNESGALDMKRGTMHTMPGHEDLPYFIVQRGSGKDSKRFDVYDAASGAAILTDSRSKQDAMDAANGMLSNDDKRNDWITKRESTGEIEQEAIDDFNNENEVETENLELFTREDIAGMSGATKFSVYDDIKKKLIAKGVPEREIAFIHDYSTPVAKNKLFKAVNEGEIRFLLGSTPKMGAGTNVQKRLVGLHHIDAPWRPSDLEQREGRIIRRGNELYERDPDGFEVFIGRYATEQTYDTRRWQILEHKARGIEQLRNYDGTINEIEDIDGEAANAADMKAAASGDPLILEETRLRNEVRRLEKLQASHADEVLAMTRKARDAEYYAKKTAPSIISEAQGLLDEAKKHKLDSEGFSPIAVQGRKPKADKESAYKELASAFNSVREHIIDTADVQYRGIDFRLEHLASSVILRTPTGSSGVWMMSDAFSPSGMVQRMKNYIDRLPDTIQDAKAHADKSIKDAAALREQAKQPFQQAGDLEKTREEHKRVQRALMAKGPQVPDEQKALLVAGIEKQKSRLRTLGYGDALDELLSNADQASLLLGNPANVGGVEIDVARSTVDRIVAANQKVWNIDISTVATFDDLPDNVKNNIAKNYGEDAAKNAKGLVHNGKVYVIANNNESEADIEQTLLHEIEGHMGVRRLYGSEITKKLNDLYIAIGGRKGLIKLANDRGITGSLVDYADMLKNTELPNETRIKIMMDEALAHYAQTPKFGDKVKAIVGMIRAWLRDHKFAKLAEFGETDLLNILRQGRQKLKTGDGGNDSALMMGDRKSGITETITIDGIDRPTRNSNGKPIYPTVEGIRNFWKWFGDSRVVDDQGRPLVVYHGTDKDFNEFKKDSFFSDDVNNAKPYGNRVVESYLKIINPEVADYSGAQDNDKDFDIEEAKDNGNDGLIILNADDGYHVGNQYIAFHPNQIKSATGNTGAFSENDESILFRKGGKEPDDYSSSVDSAQEKLFNFFGNSKEKSPKNFGLYHKTLSTQYHKALKDQHYGKVFSLANAMQNHVSLASIRPSELAPGVLPRVDDVKSAAKGLFKGAQNQKYIKKVADAMFAGTLAGKGATDGRVWDDTELKNVFGLDKTGISLYRQARAAVDASIDELAAAEGYAMAQHIVPKDMRRMIIDEPGIAGTLLKSEVERQANVLNIAIQSARKRGDDEGAARLAALQESYASTLKNLNTIFDTAAGLKKGGYAPLMRFGKWTVTAQEIDPQTGAVERDENGSPATVYFGKFDTESEAMAALDRMKEKYKDRNDIRVDSGIDSEDSHQLYAGISPETVALFGEAIGAGDVANKYYQIALSERSALKRRLERKGTPGYSQDLPRVLSNFITSNGRFSAQRYYLRDLNESIRTIPQNKGDVKDEAIQLKKFIVDPGDPAAPLSTVMFAWFLGGSVAAAMINMTQPVMMTGPYLSQFGLKSATSELTKAIPYAMGKKEITDKSLKDALQRASREGVVDAQEIFHLYSMGAQSIASGLIGTLSRIPGAGKAIKAGSDNARARINAFLTLWGSMFSLAEKFNRKLTFIAAWNMAKEKGNANPYAFAVRAVNETQGIYNKVNRPNWARNPAGRTILTFKQFSLMYVEMLSRMWKRGGPEGKRAALIMLAVLMLASGEEGLPFAQDLDDLIDTIGQLFGLDTNMRRNKREAAYQILGDKLGDMFLYGISSQLPLDVSGRLGLGNFIPGTGLLKKSDEQMRTRNAIELLGPAAGMGSQLGDAYDAATEGNSGKALQNLAPKAIKDILAAEEMARKGYSSDFKGRKVTDVGLSDAAIKASGFNPTKIANVHRKTMPLQQDISLQKITETSIANQWARGIMENDKAMIDEAKKRQDDWNKKNPRIPIAINGNQIRDRVRSLNTDKNTRLLKDSPKEMRGRIGLELLD
ncbi:MAG: PLxRFG domain-containing protein [Gammaproteobacteria bacterium]|nr:MAG: PLxRFG domain-containing protein [Gammaproteobacteria bacterium]